MESWSCSFMTWVLFSMWHWIWVNYPIKKSDLCSSHDVKSFKGLCCYWCKDSSCVHCFRPVAGCRRSGLSTVIIWHYECPWFNQLPNSGTMIQYRFVRFWGSSRDIWHPGREKVITEKKAFFSALIRRTFDTLDQGRHILWKIPIPFIVES